MSYFLGVLIDLTLTFKLGDFLKVLNKGKKVIDEQELLKIKTPKADHKVDCKPSRLDKSTIPSKS